MCALAAMVLFVGGCPDGGDEPTPDAGESCSDEGRYLCWTPTRQCCHGAWITYSDGPCQPRPDAGVAPDCAAYAMTPGCPCATEGAQECVAFGPRLDCVGGVWTSNSEYACCM